MSQKYTDEMLQEINDKADLTEYAKQNLDLIKRGRDYYAHCPLHVDKTPSLSFSPDKNMFYCFSCGKSGKMIQYLRFYEGLSFDDAVEKAAKIANVDPTKMCQSATISFLRKLKTLKNIEYTKHAKHQILDMKEFNKYKKMPVTEWQSEGISQDIMDLFGVRIDTLGNRIVYPVYDMNGNLINVKGRTRYSNYKDLRIPKYINYFPVGTMDYFQGLNITLPYIQEKHEAIIFESIKSVMLAYGWGYKNCISAEKHTLTDEQIGILVNLRVNVVFAFDTDVNYLSNDVMSSIRKLKKMTNVYIITDQNRLLGGSESKNAPVDLGRDIWETLYKQKKKIV